MDEMTFTWIDPPVGPQPIPAWAKGLDVEWMGHYLNPPEVRLKAAFDPMPEDLLWNRTGGRYWRRTAEGVHEEKSHNGALSWNDEKRAWQTTHQEGFGGRCYTIKMGRRANSSRRSIP